MNPSDNVMKFYKDYMYTENLKDIWRIGSFMSVPEKKKELSLFKV